METDGFDWRWNRHCFRILIVPKRSMASACMTNVSRCFAIFYASATEKCAIKIIIWFLHRDIVLYNEVGANLVCCFLFRLLCLVRFIVIFAGPNEMLWHTESSAAIKNYELTFFRFACKSDKKDIFETCAIGNNA